MVAYISEAHKVIIETENTTAKTCIDEESVAFVSVDGGDVFVPTHVIRALALTFLSCTKANINPKKKFTITDEDVSGLITCLPDELLYQYEKYYIVSSTETPVLLLHSVPRGADVGSHEVVELDRKTIFAVYKHYFK